MKKHKRIFQMVGICTIGVTILSGCNLYGLLYPQPTAVPASTPTPEPPIELTICLGYEPPSLYPYLAGSQASQEILDALYDGPFDVRKDGKIEAVILKKVPNFKDGSAVFSPAAVSGGDEVVNSEGDLVSLQSGTSVFPSGCTSSDCILIWDGVSELQINQLTAVYELLPELKWSDGQPLTAADSLYAFEVASDPTALISKRAIDLTHSYTVLDEQTIQWVAKPGLVTGDFEKYFWAPFPEHVWESYSADELLTAEDVNRSPLGWGAFMVDEWRSGEFLRLVKNPNYFRANEGLPAADMITYKFLQNTEPDGFALQVDSECDIVSPTALDLQKTIALGENALSSSFNWQVLQPSALEMLAFGIKPYAYDDYYYPYGVDRPDIFGDVRTRQALAHCIDRGLIHQKLLGGVVEVPDSLFQAAHPLLEGAKLSAYAFDPALGISLLEQVGWRDGDFNPDTPITASNVYNVPPGTSFEIGLLISESPLRAEIAAEIAAGLSNCGIKVNIEQLPVAEMYQPGPDGPVFGRKFDLALLSWQTAAEFNCRMFMTEEIPSDANYWLGEKTGGANYYGYSNTAYNEACTLRSQAGLNAAAYDQAGRDALTILNRELPFIPVYLHPESALIRTYLCGFSEEFSRSSGLWADIERLTVGSGCKADD